MESLTILTLLGVESGSVSYVPYFVPNLQLEKAVEVTAE